MANRMQDKESMAGITWLALLIIAGWRSGPIPDGCEAG